jgi:hypothetical protein
MWWLWILQEICMLFLSFCETHIENTEIIPLKSSRTQTEVTQFNQNNLDGKDNRLYKYIDITLKNKMWGVNR